MGGGRTHRGQFGYHNAQDGKEIDGKIREIIMGIMGAEQEEHDGHAEEKFLRGGILRPVVDLLPHVEVVVGARVEFKGHAAHPVEHQVGAEHVTDVCEGPGGFLGDARDDVEEDFEGED